MKTKLSQTPPIRLETRDGMLYIVMETPFDKGESEAAASAMQRWFRVEESAADQGLLAGRPVRQVDPQEGLFVDEEENSYRLVGGGEAKPLYAEVIALEGVPGGRPQARTNGTGMTTRVGNGAATERRRRKRHEAPCATVGRRLLEEQPCGRELNLREKFAEVRRRLGYVQKRGHNESHNYSYVMAADLAGAVGDILAELGVVMIPQLQSISTETPRSSTERIARIVMSYKFVDTKSGEELIVRVAGEGADPGDKAPYKAMTGALKYALLQSFLLASGDDPEDERGTSRGSERVITPDQAHELQKLIDETGTELERVLAYYRISALSEMTETSHRRALELLNRKLAKRNQGETAHAQV